MIDENTTEGNSPALMKHLCKSAGSVSSEVPIMDVINDIKSLKNNCKEKDSAPLSTDRKEVPGGRTLKEANVTLSLYSENQFSKSTSRTVQHYAHLSLQEFELNKSEIEAINKLSSVLFELSVQCNVVQNSLSGDQIILPSFRKWFSIDSRRLEHQSRVTYLRIINEPADNKETMIKVVNFLYNIYEV